MNSVTAVGGMVLQTFVNNMGTSYVAAYAACTKILGLFEQPANTVGLALLTFVGQNYGAGKKGADTHRYPGRSYPDDPDKYSTGSDVAVYS
ncbi:MAG: MATE family efflux transporter [Oliverpabstia sp.]